MDDLVVTGANGHRLHLPNGEQITDLVCGFGSAFLGHSNPAIGEAIAAQLDQSWITARAETPISQLAEQCISELLPRGLVFGGLYSTGMESAEYAMRIAACNTGKTVFAGFPRSMHGKSAMTANLGWENAAVDCGNSRILPVEFTSPEEEVLAKTAEFLSANPVAALFVEPVQGSNTGHYGSPAFYDALIRLCRSHDTLCIFDEVLTGLYRTGRQFFCQGLSETPDVLLFAKSLGNGFPVSAVAASDRLSLGPETLPGSTFAGNSLAAAATVATLGEMNKLNMAALVATLSDITMDTLSTLDHKGFQLNGIGALWLLNAPPSVDTSRLAQAIQARGVFVSAAGSSIRLLPPETIDVNDYQHALAVIAETCVAHS